MDGRPLLVSPGRLTGGVPVGRTGAGVGLAELGRVGAEGADAVRTGTDGFGAEGAAAALGCGLGAEADGEDALGRLIGFCGAGCRETGLFTTGGLGVSGLEGAEGVGVGLAAD